MRKLRIIVGGYIGLYPTGGVTWDYIQYPLGLKKLGHDVYYIEDTFQYSRFQLPGQDWSDPSVSVEYLKNSMERFGLKERWAYRDVATGKCFGLSESKVKALCRTADLFINISASTFLREEYLSVPVRVFIDSDPMFTQIEYQLESLSGSNDPYKMKFLLDHHTHFFSFGENIGNADCLVPDCGFTWMPTRQPVCLEYWEPDFIQRANPLFTSVMNWSVRPDLVYDNQTWGQKNSEFKKYMNIPGRLPGINFEIMITGIPPGESARAGQQGWKIADPLLTINDANRYKNYIYASTAEFSVAKETYIKSNSGWFSGRSACYLAAGKPVFTQDTAWSRYLPTGKGLFAFSDPDSAVSSVLTALQDLPQHARAARQLAEAYFDSDRILGDLIAKL